LRNDYDESILKILQNNSKDLNIKMDNLSKSIEKLVGMNNNLKAELFNYSFALFLNSLYRNEAVINKVFKSEDGSQENECDVFMRIDENMIIAFELKAYSESKIKLGKSKDDSDSVKKFFEKTIPLIKSNYSIVIPVFISLSGFENDAKEYMDNFKKKKIELQKMGNKFPVKLYYTGDELIRLNLKHNDIYSKFRKLLKTEFRIDK